MVKIYYEVPSPNLEQYTENGFGYVNGMPVFGEFITYKNIDNKTDTGISGMKIIQDSNIKGLAPFKIMKEITESFGNEKYTVNIETNKDIIPWWAIITGKSFGKINNDTNSSNELKELKKKLKEKLETTNGILYPDGTYEEQTESTESVGDTKRKEVTSNKNVKIYETEEIKPQIELVKLGEKLIELNHISIEIAFLNILEKSELIPKILYKNITNEYINFIIENKQTILINEGSFKLNIRVFLLFIQKIIQDNKINRRTQVLNPSNYLREYLRGVMWHVEYYVNLNSSYFYWYYFYDKSINPFEFKQNRDERTQDLIATELQKNYLESLEYFRSNKNYAKLYGKLNPNKTYYISDLKKMIL